MQVKKDKKNRENIVRGGMMKGTPVPRRRNISKLTKNNIMGWKSTTSEIVNNPNDRELKRPPIPLSIKIIKFNHPESSIASKERKQNGSTTKIM